MVVIGSNNSAHDICKPLAEQGVDTTMVQRSSTHVAKSDSLMESGLGALYSKQAVESGTTTKKADLTFASMPYRIMHECRIPLYDEIRERDKDFHARVEAAGFDPDFGEDAPCRRRRVRDGLRLDERLGSGGTSPTASARCGDSGRTPRRTRGDPDCPRVAGGASHELSPERVPDEKEPRSAMRSGVLSSG